MSFALGFEAALPTETPGLRFTKREKPTPAPFAVAARPTPGRTPVPPPAAALPTDGTHSRSGAGEGGAWDPLPGLGERRVQFSPSPR